MDTPVLSSGEQSTLSNWRSKYVGIFGPKSKGVEYLDKKIAEQGRDMVALADEGQFLHALIAMESQP